MVELSMTEIKSDRNPRGAGRKPLPPGRKKVKTSVSLSPDIADELSQHGDGVLSKGIEMKLRDSVVTDDDGKVVGVVHVGPGEQPFQAWHRKRHPDGRGNVHSHLGFYATMELAIAAVRRAGLV